MTFEWSAADGEVFSAEHWTAPDFVRGRLLCVHGLGGAASDFAPLGLAAAAHGFSAFALNLRGQGSDPQAKRRGRFLEPKLIARDLAAFAHALPDSEAPLFLCGESLGALLIASMLDHRAFPFPVAGVVLSVPVVDLKKPNSAWVRFLIKALARVAPTLTFDARRFVTQRSPKPWAEYLTRDQAHVEYLQSAPHRVRTFSVGVFAALGNLMEARKSLAAGLQVPTLVLGAGQDVYIAPAQLESWYDQIDAEDKTFRLYPEARHLLWNDLDRESVIADILAWLNERSARKPSVGKFF